MDYFHFIILGIFIIIAFYTDVTKSLLPNWLTMSGILVGFIYHLISDGLNGLLFSIIGMAVGGGILMLMYIFKALGAGDVKLFAAIGSITGLQFTLYAMMYSILFAGLIGVIILLVKQEFMRKMFYTIYRLFASIRSKDFKSLENFKRIESTRFPFMYAVLPGIIMTFYYFH
ncbi:MULTISPECIES: A24 family peptidase [Bacillaceae]|nr:MULTISPECIES: A24 family peptidase [Bacillaceae]